MLVANTVPYLVLYHKGYIRVSLYEYDNDDCNVTAHLTNQVSGAIIVTYYSTFPFSPFLVLVLLAFTTRRTVRSAHLALRQVQWPGGKM